MSLSDLLSIKIILASKSPRRKQLLEQMGFDVVVEPIDIKESFPESIAVDEVAEFLAVKKSENYNKSIEGNSVLVTADTIVVVDNFILGKPKSVEEAKGFLRLLSSKTHKVITGCCLKTNKTIKHFSQISNVKFKALSEDEIEYYVKLFKPFDKAGAYGIQEWIGYIGIGKIEGSFFTIMGLPVHLVYNELLNFIG
jgi:septum formation protein